MWDRVIYCVAIVVASATTGAVIGLIWGFAKLAVQQ